MGGNKKKTQQAATSASNTAADLERQRAADLQTQLGQTNSALKSDIYTAGTGSMDMAKNSAMNIANTGGYDPNQLDTLRNQTSNLALTGGYDPNVVSNVRSTLNSATSDQGYGREGYQNLADTGGYTDSQKLDYMQHAVAPTIALYGNTRDNMNRQLSVQGGYSPGFDSGSDRLLRHENQDISSANLNGRVSLDSAIQQNKLAGLGGLASTQSTINSNKLASANANAGLESNIAGAKAAGTSQGMALESSVAQGKIQGQDALQRYMDSGVNALNQNDIQQLQNRLQSGQMSQADAQLLTQIASQQKTLYDNIMQGVSSVGGVIGGIAGGFNGGTTGGSNG